MHPTDATASSSSPGPLLKTPTANLGTNGGSQHPTKRKAGGHGPTLADEIEHLLSTPRASDGAKGSPNQRNRNGSQTLASTAARLGTTPASTGPTAEGQAASHPHLGGRPRRCRYHPETPGRHEPPHGHRSPAAWWGPYLPAIRRWESVTGHTAPAPTVPGTRRLSAHLVEWMMGLPTGWVTDTTGLSRAAQLRLLGNSVVPQQAAHALDYLLTHGLPQRDLPSVPTRSTP